MAAENALRDPATPVPAERAFVVHFGPSPPWRRRFAGRAEHLSSGTFVHFGSLRALLQFFAQFVDAPEEPKP